MGANEADLAGKGTARTDDGFQRKQLDENLKCSRSHM